MTDPLREKYGSRAKVLLPLLLVGFVALSAWRMWPRPPASPIPLSPSRRAIAVAKTPPTP